MIKNNVIVIDNAVSAPVQDMLEHLFLTPEFPWYYQPSAAYDKEMYDEFKDVPYFPYTQHSLETPFLNHQIYNAKTSRVAPMFHLMTPLITAIPVTCDKLVRIASNLTFPDPRATEISYGMPHVDADTPDLITAIYYVTDSDGDTVIFNEKAGWVGELTEKQRIKPMKGRLVVFDGKFLHAGNTPRGTKPRAVVNINITGYNK